MGWTAKARGTIVLLGSLALLPAAASPSPGPPQSGHERMLAMLKEIADNPPYEHHVFPQKKVIQLREELARHMANPPAGDRDAHTLESVKLLLEIGQCELKLGNSEASVEEL